MQTLVTDLAVCVRERERCSLIIKHFEQPDCGHLMDEVGVKLTLVTILYGST